MTLDVISGATHVVSVVYDVLRWIFFFLDWIIYNKIVPGVYNLFMEISNTTLFTDDMIETFAGKVYGLVGIFMLFKVSFSILSYIVNPDEFTDKTKGISNLAKNIIISLGLLVITPWIFSEAMDIQRIILKDNVIPTLFSTENVVVDSSDNAGYNTSFMVFQAFLTNSKCEDLGCLFATDINEKDSEGEYVAEYTPIISTAVGVVLALVFISYCFDIALRSVKLGFLRILAPIPIIGRVDPKKGTETFNKWVKQCTSTYLDLFIRLAAIFFAIYVVNAMQKGAFVDAVTNEEATVSAFAKVFIVLGALMFAKQLPKLIEDLTGFKTEGKFSINPFRKVADIPIAGKLAASTAGGIDSLAHGLGFRSGFVRSWGNVPWGGDSKNSILATADAKARREARDKRAREYYEGIQRMNELNSQLRLGERYSDDIKNNHSPYNARFQESKDAVEEAKTKMYEWQNYAQKMQANYQAASSAYDNAVNMYGSDSQEAKAAFRQLGKADTDLANANKNSGSAQGQYEYRKKLHDALRQQMPRMAEIEDAIEAYEKAGGGKPIDHAPEIKEQDRPKTRPSSQQTSSYQRRYNTDSSQEP